MSVIVSAIVATGVVLLLYALLARSGRGTDPDQLRGGVPRRSEDENRPPADEPPLPPGDGESLLTQEPGPVPRSDEHVTPSLTDAAAQSCCPACGATITADDETCPSCEIAFVADGPQRWALGAVGPADGIFRPTTEISE